jgi:undecaprenyl diphosphate synthase
MSDGIEILTVYAFSSENWKRDPVEVDTLMKIFAKYADSFAKEAINRNVKVVILSTDLMRLPIAVQSSIKNLSEATSHCSGFIFNICLSYGGREDIVSACNSLIKDSKDLTDFQVTEQMFGERLSTSVLPG